MGLWMWAGAWLVVVMGMCWATWADLPDWLTVSCWRDWLFHFAWLAQVAAVAVGGAALLTFLASPDASLPFPVVVALAAALVPSVVAYGSPRDLLYCSLLEPLFDWAPGPILDALFNGSIIAWATLEKADWLCDDVSNRALRFLLRIQGPAFLDQVPLLRPEEDADWNCDCLPSASSSCLLLHPPAASCLLFSEWLRGERMEGGLGRDADLVRLLRALNELRALVEAGGIRALTARLGSQLSADPADGLAGLGHADVLCSLTMLTVLFAHRDALTGLGLAARVALLPGTALEARAAGLPALLAHLACPANGYHSDLAMASGQFETALASIPNPPAAGDMARR